MADDFIPIKRVDVPVSLFGQTELGHADIIEMDNHVKVNIRLRKDQSVVSQLMEKGLVGLSVEYDGPEALHRARREQELRENPVVDSVVAIENMKGLEDCE